MRSILAICRRLCGIWRGCARSAKTDFDSASGSSRYNHSDRRTSSHCGQDAIRVCGSHEAGESRRGGAMARFRTMAVWPGSLAMVARSARQSPAQAPTIEQSGLLQSGIGATSPGSTQSLLGPMPGGGGALGDPAGPGRDAVRAGRGRRSPRVPTSITMPGGPTRAPSGTRRSPPLSRCRRRKPPFYGRLEMPQRPQEDGPAQGLTLDQAIDHTSIRTSTCAPCSWRSPRPGPTC